LLNAVREGGASFTGLDVRKPNLEEVFLKLTDDTFLKRVAGIEEAQ
jgi:ABC-2 type transport system ATP-binding protein